MVAVDVDHVVQPTVLDVSISPVSVTTLHSAQHKWQPFVASILCLYVHLLVIEQGVEEAS